MPDQELPHDPIDKVYADAEAMLDDDAARAARRAKVLGAVAAANAPVPVANAAPSWRRYGSWMAAASVAGLSLLISLQLYRPAAPPPEAPSPPVPPVASAPPAQNPIPDQAAPPPGTPPTTPSSGWPKAERAPVADAPAVASKPTAPPAAAVETTAEETRFAKASPAPAPAPAPPPPSPARQGLAAAAPPPPPAAARETQDAVESVVVTGAMRRSAAPDTQAESVVAAPLADVAALPERLRAAAAAGRTAEIRRLLDRKTPVDAADQAGETALMKAVRGGHPDAAKLLLRGGADLDLKNQAGESARSLAAARNDRAMNKALGL